LRIRKPTAVMLRPDKDLLAEAGCRHVAIEIDDLSAIARNLDRAAVPYVEARPGDFDVAALYTLDPAMNVVAFCQRDVKQPPTADIQPWEADWGWGVHHVNLQAGDVRAAVAFYAEIAGLAEGRWRAPPSRGDFSTDPRELAVLSLGEFNRGMHIIRPDAGFALRNRFAHNPSLGGHPALFVPDVKAVKARLEAAGILVSDAGVYAMAGMYQVYVFDPSANVVDVNQFV
jgi:catechol 2,3-dioxygenase-like lactoylglutathione lyase family enzyme